VGKNIVYNMIKVWDMAEFEQYYDVQLIFILSTVQDSEKDFHAHEWHIVQKRIEHFERKDPFTPEHPQHLSNIEKLTEFQRYLGTRDKWNVRPHDVLVKEKTER